MITTAAIVTGVVGAPIARADIGADLGVPSQAGVAAAFADAVVPAVTVPESPVAAAALPPESLPPVAQAAEAALQLVSPSGGSDTVVPSQAERSSGDRRSQSVPAAREPDRPEHRSRPTAESPVSGAQQAIRRSHRSPGRNHAGRRDRGRYHRGRADDE